MNNMEITVLENLLHELATDIIDRAAKFDSDKKGKTSKCCNSNNSSTCHNNKAMMSTADPVAYAIIGQRNRNDETCSDVEEGEKESTYKCKKGGAEQNENFTIIDFVPIRLLPKKTKNNNNNNDKNKLSNCCGDIGSGKGTENGNGDDDDADNIGTDDGDADNLDDEIISDHLAEVATFITQCLVKGSQEVVGLIAPPPLAQQQKNDNANDNNNNNKNKKNNSSEVEVERLRTARISILTAVLCNDLLQALQAESNIFINNNNNNHQRNRLVLLQAKLIQISNPASSIAKEGGSSGKGREAPRFSVALASDGEGFVVPISSFPSTTAASRSSGNHKDDTKSGGGEVYSSVEPITVNIIITTTASATATSATTNGASSPSSSSSSSSSLTKSTLVRFCCPPSEWEKIIRNNNNDDKDKVEEGNEIAIWKVGMSDYYEVSSGSSSDGGKSTTIKLPIVSTTTTTTTTTTSSSSSNYLSSSEIINIEPLRHEPPSDALTSSSVIYVPLAFFPFSTTSKSTKKTKVETETPQVNFSEIRVPVSKIIECLSCVAKGVERYGTAVASSPPPHASSSSSTFKFILHQSPTIIFGGILKRALFWNGLGVLGEEEDENEEENASAEWCCCHLKHNDGVAECCGECCCCQSCSCSSCSGSTYSSSSSSSSSSSDQSENEKENVSENNKTNTDNDKDGNKSNVGGEKDKPRRLKTFRKKPRRRCNAVATNTSSPTQSEEDPIVSGVDNNNTNTCSSKLSVIDDQTLSQLRTTILADMLKGNDEHNYNFPCTINFYGKQDEKINGDKMKKTTCCGHHSSGGGGGGGDNNSENEKRHMARSISHHSSDNNNDDHNNKIQRREGAKRPCCGPPIDPNVKPFSGTVFNLISAALVLLTIVGSFLILTSPVPTD